MSRLLATLVILLTALPALGAGRYELAWWREWGMYENGGPGGGNHSIHVWVFDENGNVMPGVDIYTSWGVLQGTTNSEGRSEIVLYTDHNRDARVGDPASVDSEVTPIMTSARWPNWGHYSYDCGFMYKADAATPGDFSQDIWGTVNLRDGNDTDCPYTKSLVYNSIDYTDTYSDAFSLGHWSDSFAQTFQATAVDRIMGVMLHGTIGGNTPFTWTAQIREGGPTGTVIFSKSTPGDVYPFRYFVPFGVDDCPVIAGQTYALTLTRPGGLNTYHVANVYNNGQYFEVTTPDAGNDLVGFVLGMTYQAAGTGTLAGTVRDAQGQPVRGATVVTSPGAHETTTGTTGQYALYNVPTGTYDLTATKSGYAPQTQTGRTVTEGATTTVDFTLTSSRGLITGTVLAAEGGPLEGAFLWTSPGDYGAVTGSDGTYDIINVPPGTYTVSAYAPGRVEQQQSGKTVTAGSATTADFTLARGTRVAHLLDDFNGNYVNVGSEDYLEESFGIGFDNHAFFRTTDADRTRPPHTGTDSAQDFEVWLNNDQFVSYFESKDPVTASKDLNLVQYVASQGWEEIDLTQPITYIVYVKGHNDATDPNDPGAYWRQVLAAHRGTGGSAQIEWTADNNDTWQMLRCDATGLGNGELQWLSFEMWYPSNYGGMLYDTSWMVWDNLMIEYEPANTFVGADFDEDNDVDQADFAHLQRCMTGSEGTLDDPTCVDADLSPDAQIDQADVGVFLRCLSGAGIPADPACE